MKHFQQQGQNFHIHGNFIIIGKLINLSGSKEKLQELLVGRQNFWIQKLKALVPFGLNKDVANREGFDAAPFNLSKAAQS